MNHNASLVSDRIYIGMLVAASLTNASLVYAVTFL
jgi:hypothetical protein